jgi:hypothetical protein
VAIEHFNTFSAVKANEHFVAMALVGDEEFKDCYKRTEFCCCSWYL